MSPSPIPTRLGLPQAIALALAAALAPALADTFVLKDGRTIHGKVIERSVDSLVVRTPDNTLVYIQRRNILNPLTEYKKKRDALRGDDRAGWASLAENCLQWNLRQQAEDALSQAVRDCDDVDVLLRAAAIREKLHGPRAGRKTYERIVTLDPSCAKAHQALGHLLWQGQWVASWHEAAQAALKQTDASPQALHKLACTCWDRGGREDALALLRRVEGAEDTAPLHQVAKTYAEWDLDQQAQRVYQRMVKIDPREEHAHVALGHVELADKWYESAEVAYKQASPSCPDTADAHMDLSAWCDKHDLQAQAKQERDRALNLEPDNARARTAAGYVQLDGQWTKPIRIVSIDWRRELEIPSRSGVKILKPQAETDWFLQVHCQLHRNQLSRGQSKLAATDFGAETFAGEQSRAAALAKPGSKRLVQTLPVKPSREWVHVTVLFILHTQSRVKALRYKAFTVVR